jgi:hypothetical protein
MNNETVREKMKNYPRLKPVWGTSKSKIDAINKNVYLGGDWSVVINVSDDLSFKKEGFDLDIIEAFDKWGLDSILHFPDGHVNERLITQSIMGRKYYDRFGYIYHPSYKSVYCDNEQQDVAKALGCYHYIPIPIFVHEHHIWGYGPADDLLRKTESFYPVDAENFHQRQLKNFPLEWPQ